MSREQLTEQQTQDVASTESSTTEQTYGLPPALYGQVIRLRPGDVQGLRDLLTIYSNFSQGILSVASSRVGLATVQQAIELTERNAVGRPPATDPRAFQPGGEFELEGSSTPPRRPLTQDQIRPGGEFELEGSSTPPRRPLTQDQIRPGGEFELEGSASPPSRPLTQEQIRPGGEFELEGSASPPSRPLTQEQIRPGGEFALEGSTPPSRPLTQEQIRPGGEFALEGSASPPPGFVAAADRYNAAHASFVSEFNEATSNSCVVDGKLDAQAVARWQARYGLAPDGKVGPMTVAAARKVTVSATSGAPELDARPPV